MKQRILRALDRYFLPHVTRIVEKAIFDADITNMVESVVEEAVDECKIDRQVESAIDDARIDDTIEDAIKHAMRDLNIDELVSEAADALGLEHNELAEEAMKKVIAKMKFKLPDGTLVSLVLEKEETNVN